MEERFRMKVALGIFALCVVAVALAGYGGADDESTASSIDDSPSVVADDTDYSGDARGVELTTEGAAILSRVTDWATAGQSDPATACARLSDAESDIAEVHGIIVELGTLDSVPADDLADLQKGQAKLEVFVENIAGLCAEAGF